MFWRMGLKSVFLSARPIVLSLARSTMPSSTTLFSNNRFYQLLAPGKPWMDWSPELR